MTATIATDVADHTVTVPMAPAPIAPWTGNQQRFQRSYTAIDTAPAKARFDLRMALTAWGLPQLVDDAELIASELIANSVDYTDTRRVGLSVTRPATCTVVMVVTDTSSRIPTATIPEPMSERGRGLVLVDALATRWGTELVHGGKRMWAELTVKDGAR